VTAATFTPRQETLPDLATARAQLEQWTIEAMAEGVPRSELGAIVCRVESAWLCSLGTHQQLLETSENDATIAEALTGDVGDELLVIVYDAGQWGGCALSRLEVFAAKLESAHGR
jgi:hypothetical protein